MSHKATGEKTQAIILAHLVKHDKKVLLPFGDNQRYDLVIDENGKFIRAQCKTAWRQSDSVIAFNACSVIWHRRKRRNYLNEVDVFLVYSPDTDKIYQVPIDEVSVTAIYLRLSPTKNGQNKRVRWAKDYEI